MDNDKELEIRIQRTKHYFSKLPFHYVLKYFNDAISGNPSLTGEYKAIISRIEHQMRLSNNETLSIQASESDRLESFHFKQLTSGLVANKIGLMHCVHCKRDILAKHIIHERYIRETTTGQRFYCKEHNHLILDLIDLRRAGQTNTIAKNFKQLLSAASIDIS